jgi:hypothetical protein
LQSPIVNSNKSSGPYPNKKAAAKNSDMGLKISDMFLEIGSNVGSAARRDELGAAEIAIGRSALRP